MRKSLKTKQRFYKGGGETTTTSSIPEWAVPYLQRVGNAAQAGYESGSFGNVAGTNPLLQAAFGSGAKAIGDVANRNLGATGAASERITGLASSGGYDTKALKDAAILEAGVKTADLGNQYAARGTLGSARQGVQQGAQNAATAAQFANIDYDAAQRNFQNKLAAESALNQNVQTSQGVAEGAARSFVGLGKEARDIEQQAGDANWQAVQRYASSIYGNPARQQTVAGGGGGK